jgi:GDSL-like Lipase/Acylhydrolase family
MALNLVRAPARALAGMFALALGLSACSSTADNAADLATTTSISTTTVASSGATSGATTGVTSAPTSVPTTTSGRTLRWVALGDSYSAGIGASTPEQTVSAGCNRDPISNYPALAAAALIKAGQRIDLDVRSCEGATTGLIIGTQATDVANADIISLTLGGNDFGFSRVLTDCLARGCRSYDQPDDKFPGFTHEAGRSDWDVLEQRVTDALTALAPKLAAGGQVYVLTYPVPFPEHPDEACMSAAAPMNDVSRYLANAAIDHLDNVIVDAVTKANAAAPRPFVTVVEWRTGLDRPLRPTTDASGVVRMIRDDPDGICSPDPMLNGIASADIGDSFHPTDRGLRFAADAIAAAITTHTAGK